jgi:hypothetical protein
MIICTTHRVAIQHLRSQRRSCGPESRDTKFKIGNEIFEIASWLFTQLPIHFQLTRGYLIGEWNAVQ